MSAMSKFLSAFGVAMPKLQTFAVSGAWTHPNPENTTHLFYNMCGDGPGSGNEQSRRIAE